MSGRRQIYLALAIAAAGIALPFVAPDYRAQIAMLWALVIMAQTWDITGGQTGYNSFGNILFFGVGMYASVVVQRDVGLDYFPGLVLGMIVGAGIAAALAVLLGSMILRMRGHYFAIATLGLGIAAGEIAGGWDYLGAGSGLSPPLFPAAPATANLFFACLFFGVAALVFVALAALYRTRFGLALNANRLHRDWNQHMERVNRVHIHPYYALPHNELIERLQQLREHPATETLPAPNLARIDAILAENQRQARAVAHVKHYLAQVDEFRTDHKKLRQEARIAHTKLRNLPSYDNWRQTAERLLATGKAIAEDQKTRRPTDPASTTHTMHGTPYMPASPSSPAR